MGWNKEQIETAQVRANLAAEVTLRGDEFRDLLETVTTYREGLETIMNRQAETYGDDAKWNWIYNLAKDTLGID